MRLEDLRNEILNEKSEDKNRKQGGYKALATYVSNKVGKNITPSQVKNYLKKLDTSGTKDEIEKRAKAASNKGDYKWGTIQQILVNHFKG